MRKPSLPQTYATFGGVKEIINAVHLVEDSLRMNEGVLSRHRVEVVREFERVPPMNIEKHKITTRKDGHGFGLHCGALAAKELGGSLIIQSDGPGQGATFTLELPCPTRENSHE